MRQARSIIVLAALLAVAPAARAVTVGVLMTAGVPYYQAVHAVVVDELKKKQPDAEVVVQTPSADVMAWSNAARRFRALDVDVIVAYGAAAAGVAVTEAGGIPVVFAAVHAGTFKPPLDAATGSGWRVAAASIVKSLHAITKITKLGVVYSANDADSEAQAGEVEAMSGELSFGAERIKVEAAPELDKRLQAVDAVYLTGCGAAMAALDRIVTAARARKVPVASALGGGEDKGVVLTVTASSAELGLGVAQAVGRILGGEKPSAIPVMRSKKIDVVINLQEAESLGLKVPLDVLSTATRVIK